MLTETSHRVGVNQQYESTQPPSRNRPQHGSSDDDIDLLYLVLMQNKGITRPLSMNNTHAVITDPDNHLKPIHSCLITPAFKPLPPRLMEHGKMCVNNSYGSNSERSFLRPLIWQINHCLQLLFCDSEAIETVGCCESELTRKRFLVLVSPRSEWHRFIHSVISMHATLGASHHRQFSPLNTAVERTGSHQTTESEQSRKFGQCPALFSTVAHPVRFHHYFPPPSGSCILCRNADSPQMGLARWQGQYNTVGVDWLHSRGKAWNFN